MSHNQYPDDHPLHDYEGLLFATPGGNFGTPEEGGGNPFQNAANYANNVGNFVESQIDQVQSILNTYLIKADKSITDLGSWKITLPSDPVAPPDLKPEFNYDFKIPTVPDNWGEIPYWNLPQSPTFEGDSSVTIPNFPDFDPTYLSITIPPPPTLDVGPAPGPAPVVSTPKFPDAPVLYDVPVPVLETINVPPTPVINIPDFNPTIPDFVLPPAPAIGIDWPGEDYTSELMDSVVKQIDIFLAGGTGIRNDVQDQMFHQAADREDRITHQAVHEIEDEYTARGFVAPPGLLLRRLDGIREDRNRTKSSIGRDILIKSMDAELENLRFAVTAGIQAERLNVDLFLAAQERLFMVKRLAVEFGLQLYDYQIRAYLAAFEAVKIQVLVYKTQVDAALAEIELYKAQIDAELAKAMINKTVVDMYVAQIGALQTYVNLYVAEIQGVRAKIETEAVRVQAFGEEVDAYAALVGAEKVKFDAYDSQVRGEVAKTSITEAEARAYAAHIGGLSSGATAEARVLEANIGKYQADIGKYIGEIRGLNDQAQTQLAGIQANVSGYQASTSRYNADAGLQEALGRIELATWDGWNDKVIEAYRANISYSELNLRRVIEESRLMLSALGSSGQLATSVVGGSLAAMHVGATISGSGGTNASGNLSESYQQSESVSITDSTATSCSVNQEATINQNLEAGDTFGDKPWGTCVSGSSGGGGGAL